MKKYNPIGLALPGMLVLCVAFSGCGKKGNPLVPGTNSGPGPTGVGLPHVTSVTSAANGGPQLSNADQILILFDRPMNPGTINAKTVTLTAYGRGESGAKAGTVSYRTGQNRAVFVPDSNFVTTTGYVVTVTTGAQDLKGNPVDGNRNNVAEAASYDNSRRGVYTAGGAGNLPDMVPPMVDLNQYGPTHNNNLVTLPVILLFTTNDLDWSTLTSTSFAVYDANGNLANTGALTVDSVNLGGWRTRIRYASPNLTPGTVYTVKLSSAVKDKAGNTLDGNSNGVSELGTFDDVQWWFITRPTTGNAAPPVFSSSSISPDGLVLTVMFTETMNASLFTAANVRVYSDSAKTKYVAGTILPTLDQLGFTYSLENAPRSGNLYLWVSRNITNSDTGLKLDSNGDGVGGQEAIPPNHFGGPLASDDLWHQVR